MINETYDFSMNNKLGKRLQMYASKLKEMQTKQKEKKKSEEGEKWYDGLFRIYGICGG